MIICAKVRRNFQMAKYNSRFLTFAITETPRLLKKPKNGGRKEISARFLLECAKKAVSLHD